MSISFEAAENGSAASKFMVRPRLYAQGLRALHWGGQAIVGAAALQLRHEALRLGNPFHLDGYCVDRLLDALKLASDAGVHGG